MAIDDDTLDTSLEDDGEGWTLDFENEGGPVVPDVEDKTEDTAGEAGADEKDKSPNYVSRSEYEKMLQENAEIRGRLQQMGERPVIIERQAAEQPKQDNNSAVEAQLKAKIKQISTKLYDPDTAAEGVEELILLNDQLSTVRARQIADERLGGVGNTAVDLIVENFLSRKEKKDDLYDEIAPAFEAEIAKYDKKNYQHATREQLLPVLENIYKAAKADVLEGKYNAAKKRAAEKRQNPPNLSGGKAGNQTPPARQQKQLSDNAKKFALAAGLREEDLGDLFKPSVEDEW
jgi:hypothetical protein